MTAQALLVDYGGVLTAPVGAAFRAFERDHDLPDGAVLDLLLSAYEEGASESLVTRIELGHIEPEDFEAAVSAQFAEAGFDVPAERLIERLFDGLQAEDGGVWDLVAEARAAGVRTALLSNSWGTSAYPRDRLERVFDVQVISCEVGLRKPDPAIYRLTAERVGVPVEGCVFVDDLRRNIEVAESLGMRGVLHRGDVGETAAELSRLLGVSFSAVSV